jgi:ribokinase
LKEASRAAAASSSRFKTVVVTAGGAGVALCSQSGQEISLPSLPVTVASTHGAGDSFVGTLAARLATGDTLDDALSAANHEAARLVSTPERERIL